MPAFAFRITIEHNLEKQLRPVSILFFTNPLFFCINQRINFSQYNQIVC